MQQTPVYDYFSGADASWKNDFLRFLQQNARDTGLAGPVHEIISRFLDTYAPVKLKFSDDSLSSIRESAAYLAENGFQKFGAPLAPPAISEVLQYFERFPVYDRWREELEGKASDDIE